MSNKVNGFELKIKLADDSRVIARVNIHSNGAWVFSITPPGLLYIEE